jgi:hypothetical protein
MLKLKVFWNEYKELQDQKKNEESESTTERKKIVLTSVNNNVYNETIVNDQKSTQKQLAGCSRILFDKAATPTVALSDLPLHLIAAQEMLCHYKRHPDDDFFFQGCEYNKDTIISTVS